MKENAAIIEQMKMISYGDRTFYFISNCNRNFVIRVKITSKFFKHSHLS